MTLAELEIKLKTLGIPVAYSQFKAKTALPYLVYYSPSNDSVFADGVIVKVFTNIVIELYTKKSREKTVEIELLFADIGLEPNETYIPSEECFMTTYEFTI